MSQLIIIAIILIGFFPHNILLKAVLDMAIHNMVHQITQTYFLELPCVVFISVKMEPLSDVEIDEPSVMRIIVGEKSGGELVIEDNNTTDTYMLGTTAQAFERLLEKTLDTRCLGYVVQVPNTKAIIHSFGRAITRTLQRAPRHYVIFPSVKENDVDKLVEQVLNMRELELMPNILLAKIHSNTAVPVSLDEALSLRKLHCTNTRLQIQGQDHEDTLQQRWKFVENLSLSFSKNKTKKIAQPSCPKLTATMQCNTDNIIITTEIVTQSFVGHNPSEEVFLDVWVQFQSEGYFALCADLYPDKTRDLQGKSIKAIYLPYEPFVVMYVKDGRPVRDGIEHLIFCELLKKLNGSAEEFLDLDNFWGSIFENGTGFGIVGSIMNGNADVGFAAVYLEWYHEWLWTDFSYPYCQSSAVLVVPRPLLIPGYFVPVLPFSPAMWATVLLSMLAISVCIYFLSAVLHKFLPGFTKKRITLTRSFLDMLGMFVLQIPNARREEWQYSPWKHFMTWLFLYVLMITAMYNGGLASILTVPTYENTLDTLVQLAESDLNWSFPHESATWAFRYSDDPILNNIANKYVWMSEKQLAVTALRGDTGIVIEWLSGGVYCYGSYITIEAMSRLRQMKEPFYWAHVVLTTRKGGPYIDILNKLILEINQGGLGLFWQADVVRRLLSSRLQLLISLSRNAEDPDRDTAKTLQLYHLEGAFSLLTLGLIIAATAFVAELLMYKCRKKKH